MGIVLFIKHFWPISYLILIDLYFHSLRHHIGYQVQICHTGELPSRQLPSFFVHILCTIGDAEQTTPLYVQKEAPPLPKILNHALNPKQIATAAPGSHADGGGPGTAG